MAVELTEAQINGRFQLVNRPLAAPGKCAVCGAVDRPVLDFGFDLDFYGTVYICVEDYKAGAQLLGLVDVSQLVQPSAPLEIVTRTINEYLSNVSIAGAGLIQSIGAIPGLVSVEPGEDSGDVQEVVGREFSDDSVDGSIQDGPTEQDSDTIVNEGPASIPSNNGNGDTLPFDFS